MLFEREHERDFTVPVLLGVIEEIAEANEDIEAHTSYDAGERRAGIVQEYEDAHDEVFEELVDMLGGAFGDEDETKEFIGSALVSDAPVLADEEYAAVLEIRQEDLEVVTDYLMWLSTENERQPRRRLWGGVRVKMSSLRTRGELPGRIS